MSWRNEDLTDQEIRRLAFIEDQDPECGCDACIHDRADEEADT